MTRAPGPRSLQQALAVRLLGVVALALAAMLAVVALLFVRASDAVSERGLDSALAHYRTQARLVDTDWQVHAESMRTQIEFMRLLDEPDSVRRDARLTAYMASFGGLGTFSHLQLLDAGGQVRFRYYTRSQQDLAVPPASAGGMAWVLGERDRTVYRVLALPVSFEGGRGRLLLYAPLDNALLQRFAFPSTQVIVRLDGQAVAQLSLTPESDGGAQDTGPLARLHRASATGTLPWSDEPGAPTMQITRHAVLPLSLASTLLVVAASAAVITVLVWLVLGRWMGLQVQRLRGVQEASDRFARRAELTPQIEQALAQVAAAGDDELARTARGVAAMMGAVERAQHALTESQAQLAVLNASLEARVAERTRELAAARDEALAAARAKESFLANMSHEIRTPMNGMLGALELLGRTPLSAQQRALLSTSATSGEVLLAILNDVLDYSKIEAHRLELVQAPFSPAAVAAAAVRLFSAAAARKGVALELETSGPLPDAVLGDAARLRQVLLNLIGNAVKFTERGRITLRLQADRAADGRAALHFEVQDSGVGIDPALLPTVFEPFVQGADGRRDGHPGTGLGLAICRSIVQAMGGEIVVSSTPGAGSTFAFALTLPTAAAPAAATVPGAAGLGLPPLHGRVLVVDDNQVNRLLAAEMLGLFGLQVEQCADGQQAVERLRGERFDLVLMDNQMPVLDGLAATRQIRADEAAADRAPTPIIGLTANALDADARRNLDAGMDGHLPKPISLGQLHATLAPWLARPPA